MVTVGTGEPQMRGHIVVVDQTQPKNINICVNDDATQSIKLSVRGLNSSP